jgi:hypothetical protein
MMGPLLCGDEFQAQPEGRKIVAQCVSTGRGAVPPQPRDGAEEHTRQSVLRPVPGLANALACYPRLCAVGYYLAPFGLCMAIACQGRQGVPCLT